MKTIQNVKAAKKYSMLKIFINLKKQAPIQKYIYTVSNHKAVFELVQPKSISELLNVIKLYSKI